MKYDIVMLIGLGIGATPFMSILKDVVNCNPKVPFDHVIFTFGHVLCTFENFKCFHLLAINKTYVMHLKKTSIRKGPLKAYLYWVTREQSSFDWFRDVMKEISKSNQKQVRVNLKYP